MVKLSVQYGKLLAALQAERSEIAYAVFNSGSTKGKKSNQTRPIDVGDEDTLKYLRAMGNMSQPGRLEDGDTLRFLKNLTKRFATTDDALDSLDNWPKFKVLSNAKLFNSRLRFRIRLEDFRKQLVIFIGDVESSAVAIISVVKWYNYANQGLLDQLDLVIKGSSGSDVWRLMIAYKNLLRTLENLGISLVYGLVYYGRGVLSQTTFTEYVRYTALAEGYLNASANFAQFARGSFENITGNYAGYDQLKKSRYAILDNKPINASMEKADVYYQSMEAYLGKLRSILINLRSIIIEEIEDIVMSADQQKTVSVTVLVVVIAIAPILVLVMYRATNTTQTFAKELIRNIADLEHEKKRTSILLAQLLPEKVVAKLQSARGITAESYESITVYYSDIVGFTKICMNSTPVEVVCMLNSLYKLFDVYLNMYDVYKVETVGDAYMVVSGLPERNGVKHAAEIAKMSLDMRNGVEAFNLPHRSVSKIQIRAGIHTGPCVAGVVGTSTPRYCLFGDTVIAANKLEQLSGAMQIHVSQITKEFLDEIGSFEMKKSRETYNLRANGILASYWLEGSKDLTLTQFSDSEIRMFLTEAVPGNINELAP